MEQKSIDLRKPRDIEFNLVKDNKVRKSYMEINDYSFSTPNFESDKENKPVDSNIQIQSCKQIN